MSLCSRCGMALNPDQHDCAVCREATTTTPKEDEFDDPPVEDETNTHTDVPDFEMTTPRWNRWRRIGYVLGYGGMALWVLMSIIYRTDRPSFGESFLAFLVGGAILSFVIALLGAVFERFFGDFCDVMPFLRQPRDSEAFKTMDDAKTNRRWQSEGNQTEEQSPDVKRPPPSDADKISMPAPIRPNTKPTDSLPGDPTL